MKEKSVMNNYFGIGIDAKISLDFHNKREEKPEKSRSRAKNYFTYGVLGSRELVQRYDPKENLRTNFFLIWIRKINRRNIVNSRTYKNLEKRVILECDGETIPLPSLQGIVVLNISSFMGGTNFWGNAKEDNIFLPPSFDDGILEVRKKNEKKVAFSCKMYLGSTETWTRIAGFRVQSANHYTMEPQLKSVWLEETPWNSTWMDP